MTTTPKTEPLCNTLRIIIEEDPSGIAADVARDILDHDAPEHWIRDVLTYGCVSGCVPGLCYYHETHAFFDRHYDEIEELRLEAETEFTAPLTIDGDLKNTLAWFAYETVLDRVAGRIGITV